MKRNPHQRITEMSEHYGQRKDRRHIQRGGKERSYIKDGLLEWFPISHQQYWNWINETIPSKSEGQWFPNSMWKNKEHMIRHTVSWKMCSFSQLLESAFEKSDSQPGKRRLGYRPQEWLRGCPVQWRGLGWQLWATRGGWPAHTNAGLRALGKYGCLQMFERATSVVGK